jgi:hypothetical protein
MLNPCLLAKGVNGEIYEIPESLRKRLLVSPDRLTELRAATRAPDFYERHGMRDPTPEGGIRSLGLSFAEFLDNKTAWNAT